MTIESDDDVQADTDHSTGGGTLAVTGRYLWPGEALRAEAAYALWNGATAHARFGVTEERVQAIGLESRFAVLGRANTVDVSYRPHADVATVKVAVKQGRAKAAATLDFAQVRAERRLSAPNARYELDARLNASEALKLAYSARSNAAKIKLVRVLDARNRLDVEYNFNARDNARFVVVALKHTFSKRHALAISSNYGTRKYSVEWDYKTKAGPLTVSTDFSFDKSPHIGSWHVKRRFEF